jgi:AcrR family transcriptional regulator
MAATTTSTLLTKSTYVRKLLTSLNKPHVDKRRYHHGDLKRALVASALKIVAAEGVEGLTLRRVGTEIGVSRTALYRHFDHKAALVARIAADGFRLLCDTLKRVRANAPAGAADTLEVMAAAHVHFAAANPSHYATMFGGFLKDWRAYPELIQHADAARGHIADAVREAQRHGHISGGDPVLVADVMWALTFGVARLAASNHLSDRTAVEALAVRGIRWVADGCQTPT